MIQNATPWGMGRMGTGFGRGGAGSGIAVPSLAIRDRLGSPITDRAASFILTRV